MVEVVAIHKVTKEEILLGYCDTREQAQEDIDNNTEWNDLENQEEYDFEIYEVNFKGQ